MNDQNRDDEIKAAKRGWMFVAAVVLGLFALSYLIGT